MPEPTERPEFTRGEDFTSLYANHVQFEPSVWDLKIIFGQLDQAKGPAVVEQHTAITLAWPEAKVAAYFLLANMIGHQSKIGIIPIHNSVIPVRPDSSDPTLDEDSKGVVEYLAWVHDQFFGPNPFVPPGVG